MAMPSFIEATPVLDGKSIPCRTFMGSMARRLGIVGDGGAGLVDPGNRRRGGGACLGARDVGGALRLFKSVPSGELQGLSRGRRRSGGSAPPIPTSRDSYWLSVNYGMALEAERLGVALQVVGSRRVIPTSPARPPRYATAPPGRPTFSWSAP